MAETYIFTGDNAELILGPNDRYLSYLELILGSDITVKGNTLTLWRNSNLFIPLMKRLEKISAERGALSEGEIYMELQAVRDEEGEEKEEERSEVKTTRESITVLGKSVWPKTKKQREFISSLFTNQLIFASGPAGSGKTFLSVAYALEEIFSGRKNRIVLTRPVVDGRRIRKRI